MVTFIVTFVDLFEGRDAPSYFLGNISVIFRVFFGVIGFLLVTILSMCFIPRRNLELVLLNPGMMVV